jgi:citrate lyase beta subunit
MPKHKTGLSWIAADYFKANRGRIIPCDELRAFLEGKRGPLPDYAAKQAVSVARADGLPVETITAYRLVRKK